MKNTEENSEKIWKILEKDKLIMIRYGKQRRKYSKDLENMEERKVEQ